MEVNKNKFTDVQGENMHLISNWMEATTTVVCKLIKLMNMILYS
jgi:hypothetical protein